MEFTAKQELACGALHIAPSRTLCAPQFPFYLLNLQTYCVVLCCVRISWDWERLARTMFHRTIFGIDCNACTDWWSMCKIIQLLLSNHNQKSRWIPEKKNLLHFQSNLHKMIEIERKHQHNWNANEMQKKKKIPNQIKIVF